MELNSSSDPKQDSSCKECNKDFSSSYMLLNPEDLTFSDLFRILFSDDIESRKFVDSSAKKEESFRRRFIIFVSILVQKILMFTAKPIAAVGSTAEFGLNLLSSNGNVAKLICNFFTGKVVIPEKSSADFISYVGNFDKRKELDRSIQVGDGRYYPYMSMMASKAAYENKAYLETVVQDHWKMEFLGTFDYWNDYQQKATTQAFMFYDKNDQDDTIFVSFRGTETFDSDAWSSNFDLSWYELPGMGTIHSGFLKCLGLQKSIGFPKKCEENKNRKATLCYYAIRDMLIDLLKKNDRANFILTGHSQGGALAVLFPAILMFHGGDEENFLLERLKGVYTFGQPRVGDTTFAEIMKKKMKEYKIKYFRFVYCNDMVPRLPYDDTDLMFKHFGTCVYYNRDYEGKVVSEEPHKNYFSPVGAVPMMINAVHELIRSFSIAYTKGPDYKEGWFMLVFRVIGLLIPGIPNHCPQDYVNTTRLGSESIFISDEKII